MVSISPSLREAARRGNLFQFFWIASLTLAMTALLCAPAHAACSNPSGGAGDMIFNDDYNILQYCNGADEWIPMYPQYYWANAVEFDGTNDYLNLLSYPFSGLDDKKLTISFWFRKSVGMPASTEYIMRDNTSAFTINSYSGGYIYFNINAASGGAALTVNTSVINDTNWHHVILSVDMSDPTKRHIYLDGVSDLNVVAYNDQVLDFDNSSYGIGATSGGATNFNGDLADFWVDFGTYIDLSDADNRAKFYDATRGKPVYLGADGSLPTGSAPDIFLSGDTASWHTNKGTSGGFTENGTIDDAGTSPSGINDIGLSTGLVGHWKLDETGNTSTASDDGSGGNDGTLTNFPADPSANWVDGMITGALQFDGTDDYIDTGYTRNIGANENISYSFWFKRNTASATSDQNFLGAIDGLPTVYAEIDGDGSVCSDEALMFAIEDDDGPGEDRICTTTTFGDTLWHHIVYTYDDENEMKVYIDGTLDNTVATADSGGAIDLSGRNFYIGALNDSGTVANYFDGIVDDVRIYDRLLTAAEALQLAKSCFNPTAPRGAVQYDSDRDVMTFCDGADWLAMAAAGDGDAGGGCANPSGGAGDMVYNTDHGVMQYCEGDEWIAIVNPPDIESDLLGHWKFDESGNTSTADDSANSYDGTLTDFPADPTSDWVGGQVGNALDFDGTDDHVVVSNTITSGLTNQFSWGAWVNSDGDQSSWSPVFQQRADGGGGNGAAFDILIADGVDDDIRVGVENSSGTDTDVDSGENLVDYIGTWVHIMAVYDGTNIIAYINGVETARSPATGNIQLNSNKVTIGGGANGAGDVVNEFFNGKIDDVRFYDRALSAADVKTLYQSAQ